MMHKPSRARGNHLPSHRTTERPMVGSTFSHYRILEVLGQGGMGVVYKAQDAVLERVVALKVMRPEMLASPELRARFLREARSAAALNHPNIAHIYEAAEAD